MDLDRWTEIKAVVQEVLDSPAEERQPRLRKLCGDDLELLREAEVLLAVSTSQADAYDDVRIEHPTLRETTLAEGDAVGLYTILRPISEGGMGRVYLAHDSRHDREVAIKLLRSSAARLPFREKKLLAKLTHPNIEVAPVSWTGKLL